MLMLQDDKKNLVHCGHDIQRVNTLFSADLATNGIPFVAEQSEKCNKNKKFVLFNQIRHRVQVHRNTKVNWTKYK